MFAFLDPFGLAVSRQQLVDILQRSDRRRPVDVLYHFSVLTVARMGMAGISPTAPTAAENATQLDRAMGAAVDWRGAFAAAPGGDGAATETAIRVAPMFGESILEQTGVRVTAIEVRQQPTHLPKYLLMLFSADPTGEAHWEFAGNAAKAYAEWLLHCDTAVYEANLAETERHGVMSLFEPDPAPTLEEVAKSLAEIAARYFDDYLARLIRQRKSVRLVDDIEGAFGAMLGRAGEPAIRASIKRLRTAELIDDDGTGDFHLRTIKWVGPNE